MATVTATEFIRKAAEVYDLADTEGEVKINHYQYPGRIFVLTTRDRDPLGGEGGDSDKSDIIPETT